MPEPTSDTFHIRLINDFQAIETFGAGAHAFLIQQGVPEEALLKLDFCFEEIFTNIVKYSFPEDEEHWIDATVSGNQEGMTLRIEDDGKPFAPADAPAPDFSLPIEERPIGGLGLFLVRSMASGIDYENTGGRNRLTVHLTSETD